jgi:hypothetical protein
MSLRKVKLCVGIIIWPTFEKQAESDGVVLCVYLTRFSRDLEIPPWGFVPVPIMMWQDNTVGIA